VKLANLDSPGKKLLNVHAVTQQLPTVVSRTAVQLMVVLVLGLQID